MLPLIIQSDQVVPFRFWLKDHIHEGLHYCGELFCCVQTFAARQRAKVYHLACKLEYQGTPTLLLLSPTQCSLWVSLRGAMVEKLLLHPIPPELSALPLVLPPAAPTTRHESMAARATPATDAPPLAGDRGQSPSLSFQNSLPIEEVEATS